MLITLSGPEGSGKSTNQVFILELARAHGLSAAAITCHELSVGTTVTKLGQRLGIMKRRGRFAAQSEAERALPHSPPDRVPLKYRLRARVRTLRRAVSYIVDALTIRLYVRFGACRDNDIVVMDRYLYDAMSRLTEELPGLVRWLAILVPRPDAAFLLLGDPSELVTRRPGSTREYHEMVLHRYTLLGSLCPELVVLGRGDIKATQSAIQSRLEQLLTKRAAESVQRHYKGSTS